MPEGMSLRYADDPIFSGARLAVAKDFDLDTGKLPKWIKDAALSSGGFPYAERLDKDTYKDELEQLQLQLVKLQAHMKATGERMVIVFEGRDAAGKSSSINAWREHLNPRTTIIAALPVPSDREKTQWYFQRYAGFLPAAGETILFDRSWYNRSGIEPVMGFSTPAQAAAFLEEAPHFEKMIVDDGIRLFKFWLSIGREMQMKRFWERRHDPLKSWKLSPIDVKALDLWDAYSEAAEQTLTATDTAYAPWTVVESNDERRARLNTIRTVLHALPYEGKDDAAIGAIDPQIVLGASEFLAKNRQTP
jgi:polyphosphate kinase 2